VVKVDINNMALAGYVHVGGLPIDVQAFTDGRYSTSPTRDGWVSR